jgi:DNA-directed RNA polymerase beta subunit
MSNKNYKLKIVENILRNEFLPHVGTDFNKKALYLGYMVNKLLKCFIRVLPMDDRDSYINKRVDTPGILMANLFRQYYGKLIKDMKNMLQKEVNNGSWKATNNFINVINKVNINKIIKSTIIESGIKYGLATGNWGIKNNKTKQGVAQVLNRMTYNATISHLRRINTPIEKSGKLVQPRKLHATQWGVICPCETPEGASVGLVKNLAITAYVTSSSCSNNVREYLQMNGVIVTFDPNQIKNNTLIIVNGDIIGYHSDPTTLLKNMKNLKLNGGINIYTSIFWKHSLNEMHFCTESGRCVRPLFVIEDNDVVVKKYDKSIKEKKLGWNQLTMQGAVEYIDVEEANVSMIAMFHKDIIDSDKKNIKYTHLELHPSIILGALAGSIPFSDHNQAPRNTYQCLWEEEPVLMADGTWKKIKDVLVGDQVVTFDPSNMRPSYTKVINQYVRKTEKPIVKVTTETGREIIVTNDHLFMTNKGWVPACNLMEDNIKVGIYIYPTFNDDHNVDRYSIESTISRLTGYDLFPVDNKHELYYEDIRLVPDYQIQKYTELPLWLNTPYNAKEFISGFHGAYMNENGFVNIIDKDYNIIQQIIDIMQQVLFIEIELNQDGYYIKNLNDYMTRIGISYNYALNTSLGLKSEYTKYCSQNYESYPVWRNNIDTTYNTQFQKVISIEYRDNCIISDITTESDNHSFIGGQGFMVHNSAMGKQAIGVYSLNYNERYDSIGHILNYPQKPIVYTKTAQIVNTDELPCGMNVIVAIATYTGFNQEDSVIMNKSSIDRGMFQSTVYRTYKDQNNKNHSTGEEEFYCHPSNEGVKQLKPYNYSKLESNGFVKENTCVNGSDIIIGKCMPQKINGNIVNKDMSCSLKNNEVCFIDRNCVNDKYFNNTNGDGYYFSKIRVRSDRIPTIGDKFSCYTSDHEVLTTNGWIKIPDLNIDHEVATLVDNELVYQHPTEIQKYEYNSELYEIITDDISLCVTPNHRMYAKLMNENSQYDCVEIRDQVRHKEVRYKLNACNWFNGKMDDMFVYDKNNCITHIIIQETNKQIDIEQFLKTFGYWFSNYFNSTNNNITFDENISNMFDNRDLFPDWIWHLHRHQCRILIDAMNIDVLVSSSIELVDNMDRLCLHAGWHCDKDYSNNGEWKISIRKTNLEPIVNVNDIRIHKSENLPYHNGYVYCCTVPKGKGVIFVRRNYKSCFCGQSRHGQKGTVGMIYRQEDMPFTKDGIVPDIIMNPHAVPSRMTIGQLMECIMGKSCVIKGTRGDGTPFTDVNVEDLADELQKCGLEKYGNEILYNSRTGEMMETEIFIGPTYYQRLKHLVQDKVHSRSNNGPVVLLTRQPAEGRARDGGLRLGEMEIECKWAHGCMQFAKERFMECSDNYRLFICKQCGMTATAANPEKNIWLCKSCKNTTEFGEVRLPYACKLLFQEVQTMNIAARFLTN